MSENKAARVVRRLARCAEVAYRSGLRGCPRIPRSMNTEDRSRLRRPVNSRGPRRSRAPVVAACVETPPRSRWEDDRAPRPTLSAVIVVDGTDSVLLFLVKDPVDPKPTLWITPGGGIKPDEALSKAAAIAF